MSRLLSRLLSTVPPSPLRAYKASCLSGAAAAPRTAYTQLFSMRSGVDRSVAEGVRQLCRTGAHQGQTSGMAPGFVQANFVALPHQHAFDFLRFCLTNPRACPLLEVTSPGDALTHTVATSADLRTDMPKYRVWREGALAEERTDISELWTDDMVGFLLGCSFSWEKRLEEAHLTPRQIEERRNVPMYRTSLPNEHVGRFGGTLVVSMRPYASLHLERVQAITSCFPGAHGGPIHWGDPTDLGISMDLHVEEPDWGDRVSIRDGELPVFWACGVTPQEALVSARLPLAITHAPGHMLVCDLTDDELRISPSLQVSSFP